MREAWTEDRPHAGEEGSLQDQLNLFFADAKVDPAIKRTIRDKKLAIALSLKMKTFVYPGDGSEVILDVRLLCIDDIAARHYEPAQSPTQTLSDENFKAGVDFTTYAHRIHPWGGTYVNVGALPEVERWCQQKRWTPIPVNSSSTKAEGYYKLRMDNPHELAPIILFSARGLAQMIRRGGRQLGPK